MKEAETLGRRLRHFRQAANLTQEKLATATGLGVSNIRNWEQGHRTPNVFALYRLARALRVPMERLVEGVAQGSSGGKSTKRRTRGSTPLRKPS